MTEKDPELNPEVEEGSPPAEPVMKTITEEEYQKLTAEAQEYKDKYLRLLAESENARKRLQKEKQDLTQFAIDNLACDFLSPIDHMENALKYTDNMSADVKHWATGFQMILSQFLDVLASNGITAIDSVGNAFDPHKHEAIEIVTTTEYKPGVVVSESVRGYRRGDRTIRPARVTVSQLPSNNDQETK
jgi:molecular chaperone GrpE